MTGRIGAGLAVTTALLLAGCGDHAPRAGNMTGGDMAAAGAANATAAATAAPMPAAAATPTPVAPLPDADDATGGATGSALANGNDAATDPEPGSAASARAVVERYYAAIDRGDFEAAYRLWDGDGQASHQSFAAFKRGFARTAATSVVTSAPTDPEGAAGSAYIDVPVTVRAQLKDGTQQRFTGHYTLRRVNDVDGSTAEQRRWHLYSATLKGG